MEMKPFQFLSNPRLFFGAGKINELPALADSIGSSVLLVTGNSFRNSARWDGLIEGLKKKKITVHEFLASGEPSVENVDLAAGEARHKNVHAVISIGGGSAIDLGKAVSAMVPQEGSVQDFLEGVGTKKHDGIKAPFIAVPTTAGTGSEATKNAVISRTGRNGFKKSLRHDNLVPDIALVDPELTLGAPPEVCAASGLDAFTQLLESYLSPDANALTDTLAESGMWFAATSLLKICMTDPGDMEARSAMSYAAYLSGLTLANAGLGIVHGLASVIGGWYEIPHGVICGTLLEAATEANIKKALSTKNRPALDKFARAGFIVSESESSPEQALELLTSAIRGWADKLELPKLSEFGLKKDDASRIAEKARAKTNAVELSKEEIEEILLKRI